MEFETIQYEVKDVFAYLILLGDNACFWRDSKHSLLEVC